MYHTTFHYRIHGQSTSLQARSALYRFQTNSFSSNLDDDDQQNNIVSPKKATLKKVSEFHESIQKQLTDKLSDNSSFWALTAMDQQHKKWIEQYNLELAKHKTSEFEMDSFKTFTSSLQYIGYNVFDSIQRFRMRGLKKKIICYEEFMIGALNSFKSLQTINDKDKIKISRCFSSNLYDQIPEIKHALFNVNEKGKEYVISNIIPFGSSLYFTEALSHNLEMHFTVRYYYSLQSDNIEQDTIHRYADVEWCGIFQPQLGNQGKLESFILSDKGFLIKDIDIDNC